MTEVLTMREDSVLVLVAGGQQHYNHICKDPVAPEIRQLHPASSGNMRDCLALYLKSRRAV